MYDIFDTFKNLCKYHNVPGERFKKKWLPVHKKEKLVQ
jgi:hypothetical protein